MVAHLCVVLGVFSGWPALIFQSDARHQAYVIEHPDRVTWVLHHLDHPQDQPLLQSVHLSLVDHTQHHAEHPQHEPDHQFTILDTNFEAAFVTLAQKIDSSDFIFLSLLVLLLDAFLKLLFDRVPRRLGRIPILTTPLRNVRAVLCRSIVLRH